MEDRTGVNPWVVQWRTDDERDHFGDFESVQAARVYYELLKLCGAQPTDVWPLSRAAGSGR